MKPLTIMCQPRLKRPSAGWGAGAMMVASAWTISPLAGAGPHVFVLAGACAKRTICQPRLKRPSAGWGAGAMMVASAWTISPLAGAGPHVFVLAGACAKRTILSRVLGGMGRRRDDGRLGLDDLPFGGSGPACVRAGRGLCEAHDLVARGAFDFVGSPRAFLLGGSGALDGLRHEVLLRVEGRLALRAGNGDPASACVELAGLHVGRLALRAGNGDPASACVELAGLHVVAQLVGHVVTHHGAAGGVEDLSITSRSVREFILKKACAGMPARARAISRSRPSMTSGLRPAGATPR